MSSISSPDDNSNSNDDLVENVQPHFREEEEEAPGGGGDFSYTPYVAEDPISYQISPPEIKQEKEKEKEEGLVGVQFHSPSPGLELQLPHSRLYPSGSSEDFSVPPSLDDLPDDLPDAVPNDSVQNLEPHYSYHPSHQLVAPIPPTPGDYMQNVPFPTLPPLPSDLDLQRHRILDSTSTQPRSLTIDNSVELVNPMSGGEEEDEEGVGNDEHKFSDPVVLPPLPLPNQINQSLDHSHIDERQQNSSPSPALSSASVPQRNSGSLQNASTPTPSNPDYRPLPPRTGISHKTLTPQDRAQFGTLSSHELNTPIDADSDEEELGNASPMDPVSAGSVNNAPLSPDLHSHPPINTNNQDQVPPSDIRFKYTPVEEEPGEKPLPLQHDQNGQSSPPANYASLAVADAVTATAATTAAAAGTSYLSPHAYDATARSSDAAPSSYNYRYAETNASGPVSAPSGNPLSPYATAASSPYPYPPSPYHHSPSPYPSPITPTTPYSYAYFAPATDTPTPYAVSPSPAAYEYKQPHPAPYHHSIAQIGSLTPMGYPSPYYNTTSPYHVVQMPPPSYGEGEETPGEEREGHVRGEGERGEGDAEGGVGVRAADPVMVIVDEKDAEVKELYESQEAARVAAALAEGEKGQGQGNSAVVVKHPASSSKQVQPEKYRLLSPGSKVGEIKEIKEEDGIELARAGSGYQKSPRQTKGAPINKDKLKKAGLSPDAVLDADQLAALAAVEREEEEDDAYYQNMRREGESERKKAEEEKAKRRRERRARREAGGQIGPEDYVAVEPIKYWRVFTPAVICADIVLFLLMLHYNNWIFDSPNNNPTYGPPIATLVHWGAKDTKLILSGDWWRLFVPIVLDAGIIQIVFVLMTLIQTSWQLEELYGFHRLFIIWLLSGVFGEAVSALFSTTLVGVGASGAIYGLIGALFGDFLHTYEHMQGQSLYFVRLIITASIGFILGLLPFVDNWAQIGGFIMGIFTSCVLFAGVTPDPDTGVRNYKWSLTITSLVIVIILYVVVLLSLYYEVDPSDWCEYCHWVACLDTPYWTCQSAGVCINITDPLLTYRNPDYSCP